MRKPNKSQTVSKSIKVDRLDMRILGALSDRARQTLTELSKEVGLSPTPCSTRLERLESEQIIKGYRADIDFERLGDLSLYFVTISAKTYTPDLAEKLEAVIAQNPYIVAADGLFGSLDYLLQIYARSAQHYHEIIAPLLEFEIDYETWPVSRRLKSPHFAALVDEIQRRSS